MQHFMINKKGNSILYTQTQIIYMVMSCQTSSRRGFKWINPTKFDLNIVVAIQRLCFTS